MKLRAEEITQIIKKQLADFEAKLDVAETGTVITVGDGIAKIYGLENAQAGELVDFGEGVMGLVMNLEEGSVGASILGDDTIIKEGRSVKRTGKIFEVPVGEARKRRPLHGAAVGSVAVFEDVIKQIARPDRRVRSREPKEQQSCCEETLGHGERLC